MKINFKFLIMLLSAVLVILFFNITTVNATELKTIKFKDKNLYMTIVNMFKHEEYVENIDPENLTITMPQNQIESFTGLGYLGGHNITNLSGLENFTNLETLFLEHNNISDISSLKKLTNLKELYLEQNQIEDISTLENLTNLIHLELGGNQISNITALQNLTNLEYLSLVDNQISDLESLRGLKELRNLYVNKNKISTNLKPLASLVNVTFLDLSNNQIIDVSELANMKNLNGLRLDYNNITDASPLANIQSLIELNINYNKNLDFDTLENIDIDRLYCRQSLEVDVDMQRGSKKEFDFPIFYKKALDPTSNLFVNAWTGTYGWDICSDSDYIKIDKERQKIIINAPTDYSYNKLKIYTYTVNEGGYSDGVVIRRKSIF